VSLTPRERIIQDLLDEQKAYGCIRAETLYAIRGRTGISSPELEGITSFFSRFRMKPSGLHSINVCTGTACHVKGAGALGDAFRSWLKIPEGGDTDPEGMFTVDTVACLGCCMIAPAVQIDEIVYGKLTPLDVPSVIADFLDEQGAAPSGSGTRPPARGSRGEVRICLCSSCSAAGAGAIWEAFHAYGDGFGLKSVSCTGVSYEAPMVEVITPSGASFRYGRILPEQVHLIVERHFKNTSLPGRIARIPQGIARRLLAEPALQAVTRFLVRADGSSADAAYWTRQKRLVTEGFGALHPLDMDEYAAAGGLAALKRAAGMRPEDIISTIEKAGLRGRGGGGFPTAEKWRSVAGSGAGPRFIVCNGDEGDPGAFMDRMLLESFPFRVIEGMAIAAMAVGAEEGFIYVRAEYPVALERTAEALRILAERGVIGADVLGSGRRLALEVVRGAGAFVCGEETALIEALEGRRGTPRYRPPFPSETGFRSRPTLVKNVETYALVPWVIRQGAAAFAAVGSEKSRGTKTFALSGKVERGGLIEVAMGTALREIVEVIGGGAREGRAVKAVQVGGPSGGCVPASLLDTQVDFEALLSAGAFMGSGGMVVLDDGDCMVDIARYFLDFSRRESCGACVWCRVGSMRMAEILGRITEGAGRPGDLDALEEIGGLMRKASLCGLGRSAPNPVFSTLRHFRAEYEEHLLGRCPAKKCRALIRYEVSEKCIGCTKCHQVCPADAIPFTPFQRAVIDGTKCTRCGLCSRVCPTGAVEVLS
jgi:NADH-quinone oxidoreductase subunit F